MKAGFPGRWPSLNSDGVPKTLKIQMKMQVNEIMVV